MKIELSLTLSLSASPNNSVSSKPILPTAASKLVILIFSTLLFVSLLISKQGLHNKNESVWIQKKKITFKIKNQYERGMKLLCFRHNTFSLSEIFEYYTRSLGNNPYLLCIASLITFIGIIDGFCLSDRGLAWLSQDESSAKRSDYFEDQYIYIFLFGKFMGAISSYLLSDMFGRRFSLIMSLSCCSISLAWFSLLSSISKILTARFFVGCAIGSSLPTIIVYISEVCYTLNSVLLISCLSLDG